MVVDYLYACLFDWGRGGRWMNFVLSATERAACARRIEAGQNRKGIFSAPQIRRRG